MQDTIVLTISCNQFTRCIRLSKKEGQNNNNNNNNQKKKKQNKKQKQAGLFVFRKRFVFYRFTLQENLGDKSGGV